MPAKGHEGMGACAFPVFLTKSDIEKRSRPEGFPFHVNSKWARFAFFSVSSGKKNRSMKQKNNPNKGIGA
jgi:hypothetical protein